MVAGRRVLTCFPWIFIPRTSTSSLEGAASTLEVQQKQASATIWEAARAHRAPAAKVSASVDPCAMARAHWETIVLAMGPAKGGGRTPTSRPMEKGQREPSCQNGCRLGELCSLSTVVTHGHARIP